MCSADPTAYSSLILWERMHRTHILGVPAEESCLKTFNKHTKFKVVKEYSTEMIRYRMK